MMRLGAVHGGGLPAQNIRKLCYTAHFEPSLLQQEDNSLLTVQDPVARKISLEHCNFLPIKVLLCSEHTPLSRILSSVQHTHSSVKKTPLVRTDTPHSIRLIRQSSDKDTNTPLFRDTPRHRKSSLSSIHTSLLRVHSSVRINTPQSVRNIPQSPIHYTTTTPSTRHCSVSKTLLFQEHTLLLSTIFSVNETLFTSVNQQQHTSLSSTQPSLDKTFLYQIKK